jgi:hypothetical protein
MTMRLRLAFFAACFGTLAVGPYLLASSPYEAEIMVVDMQAHPFCAAEGHVGTQNLLGHPRPALWNAIIGEGDIECASSSTLVVVVLSAAPNRFLGHSQAYVVATFTGAAGDSVVTVERALGIADDRGRYHVPVWLDDTGCQPIRLRAWVTGQERNAREDILDFRCGE